MPCNSEVNVWRPRTSCENVHDGADPTLTDSDAAIAIGTETPDTAPNISIGPTLIQAKGTATTAAELKLNSLGGDITMGGSGVGSGTVYARNPNNDILERVLTITDQVFSMNVGNEITSATHNILSTEFYKKTIHNVTSGGTLTITDALSGVDIGAEAVYLAHGGGGITGVSATGSQTLIAPASGTAVVYGRSCTIVKVDANQWQYIGP